MHWVLPFQSGDYQVVVRNAAGVATSEPGDRYLLQVSVDLEQWTDLDEVLNQDGYLELQIEETTRQAFRFLRLLLIP